MKMLCKILYECNINYININVKTIKEMQIFLLLSLYPVRSLFFYATEVVVLRIFIPTVKLKIYNCNLICFGVILSYLIIFLSLHTHNKVIKRYVSSFLFSFLFDGFLQHSSFIGRDE